jgi:transglutaminase-like putative cysteine protease
MSAPPNSAPTLKGAIDQYFEISLFLLVATGFLTLAMTGQLDVPSIVLVSIAFLLQCYLLIRRKKVVISDRWTTPLSIIYFVFFAVDYLGFSRGFLPATIHLALFGAVVRMFSMRRERDYITMAILAFLMVLASAVLTVDSTFLLLFAIFLLMAIATFALMEMRRSATAATIQARPAGDPQQQRRFVLALTRFAPALLGMILLAGTVLFFVMPRISAGYLGGYSYGTDFSSGFSDHVQLGRIGQIQQSNAVVMHIQIEGDDKGRYDLHWRGIALAEFDGHAWSSLRDQFILPRQPDSSFGLPRAENAPKSYAASELAKQKIIRYRVLMEPIGTNIFFLAPVGRNIRGDYRLLAGDSGGAVYDYDSQHAPSRYEAVSDIATPSPSELRKAGNDYQGHVAPTYLILPELDSRIHQLASEITQSKQNNYDKAAALETYLRTRYGYTLQLSQTNTKDPIADFLFVRKQGHCEYFASAMAVMLRTLGIPSRVVNGFRSDEFNDITASYVVRAKDAHAWVEAYFPGYGWQTFDPTPAGDAGTPQGWARIELYFDAMSSFWRDWVVTYDSSNQYVLTRTAITGSRNMLEGVRRWASSHYASMLRWARRSQDRVEKAPRQWLMFGGIVLAALLLFANLGRLVRWVHENWLGSHPERSPELAAAVWYQRMARMLAKRGIQKPQTQTPQEFVREIENVRLREPVAQFTDVYELARFGNSADDARRLPELYEEVLTATRSD